MLHDAMIYLLALTYVCLILLLILAQVEPLSCSKDVLALLLMVLLVITLYRL